MNTKPTRLFLVRHAETEWNVAEVFQGQLDSALTPKGVRQAAQLAERLASEGVQAVYSSDLGRAMETARIVAERLGLAVKPSAELREIHCGHWTGKSYQEVRRLWPEEFDNWRNRPHIHRMPGGESVAEAQQRVLRFMERVRAEHPGQTVCAITHNTGIRVAVTHLLDKPLSELWDGARQPNCALNLVEMRNGTSALVEIAATDHLTAISTIEFSV